LLPERKTAAPSSQTCKEGRGALIFAVIIAKLLSNLPMELRHKFAKLAI
jgi:hypothetical protein